jgi:putative phage-type endonuclease
MIVNYDDMTAKVQGTRILADTREISREKWLDLRRQGIGGSDAGAIMGMSKWKSPMMVYMDKVGLAPETEDNAAMKHGRRMEPVIRKEVPELLLEELGLKAEVFASPYVYQSEIITDFPMLANIDGLVFLEGDDKEHGLEIKTASVYTSKEWKDNQVPDAYYAQAHHYMAALGQARYYFPVLLGNELILRVVERNEDFIEKLLEMERTFWDEYVLPKIMPAPSGGDNEDEFIMNLYSTPTDAIIQAGELEGAADRYLDLNARLKELETEKKALSQEFKLRIGEAKKAIAGAREITWSRFEQNRIDTTRIKKEAPQVFEQFKKSINTGRLTVK